MFAPKDWETAPVFFYIDVKRYRLVGANFAGAEARLRPTRIWVFLSEDTPVPDEIARALYAFSRTSVLQAPRVRVELYSRSGP